MTNYKILMTGASGFVGGALSSYLRDKGHTVVPLIRTSHPFKESSEVVYWDPDRESIELNQLEGFDAVIHLAGDNIANGRWTKRKKEAIFLSRARNTWLFSLALTRLIHPPRFFFSASAIGYYGDRGNEWLNEESGPGQGFLSELCVRWEKASDVLTSQGIRVVKGRFGLVLSPMGGVVKKLSPFFRRGLGMCIGKGTQWISWIALEDLIRAIMFTIKNEELRGTFNIVSPQPALNREFMEELARSFNRSCLFSIPNWLVKWGYGEKARELLLASQKTLPQALLKAGFTFNQPTLSLAFR